MDFKQLEAYVKVIELCSFSKAADEIYISQPSVSAYISALEKELQTPLIFRSTKELMPTNAGKIFYEYAKDMLALRRNSIYSLKKMSDCTVGNIDIIASSVPAQYILPNIISAFHRRYRGITFNLNQADTIEVIRAISQQQTELGFVGAKIENPKCIYQHFETDKLVIITPYSEKYLKVDNILDLLYSEYFIMREAGSGTRLKYEEFMRDIGVSLAKLKVSACFNNTEGIIQAVASGLGISIVSERAAQNFIQQKLVLPVFVDYPSLIRSFFTVVRKNYAISPVVQNFIDFAVSYEK